MLVLLIFVFIAVGFSFLCSVAEAVILSTPMSYVVGLENNQKRSGKILRKLKENISSPLAVILTFNTIAHTLGAAGAGAQAVKVFGDVYLAAFSAVLTFLILVLSEIIPKALGAQYWRALAPATGICLHYLIYVFYPFVILSNKLTGLISPENQEHTFKRDEFAAMAQVGAEEGALAKKESIVLQNLINLRNAKVKQVMTPRPVVFSVSENATVETFVSQHAENLYSRIPLFNDQKQITGFVLRRDILSAHADKKHTQPLKSFLRELPAILDEMSLISAFEGCISKNQHILLVVDEYGDTKGLITMEDIFETLIGSQILDEGDEVEDLQAHARKLGEVRRKKLLS